MGTPGFMDQGEAVSSGKLMLAERVRACEDLLNQMSPGEGERTRVWYLENLEIERL